MIKGPRRGDPGDQENRAESSVESTAQGRTGSAARIMSAVEAFADRYSRFIVARRIWLIVIALIIVPLFGFRLFFVNSSADARVFFGKDNPELIALQDLENTYADSDSVLFVVTDKKESLFSPDGLKALAQMTDDLSQAPYVLRVDSIANFQAMHSKGDEISVASLYEPNESFTPQRLAEIKRETLSENELVNSLISPDGRVTGIVMSSILPKHDSNAIEKVSEYSRNLADQWEARWPFLEVRVTGGIIADMAFSEASDRDEQTLVPIMGLILFSALAIGLRSIWATLVVMAVVASAAITGLGTAVWFGSTINAATATSPIAIMVLALASAVHLLISWIRAASEGLSSKEAVCESVKVNFAPIAVTSITTIFGFLSLNFSDSPPLRDLGNIVAIGSAYSWIICLTLLPALISYVRPAKPLMIDAAAGIFHWVGKIDTKHPVKLIVIFAVLSAVLGYGTTRIVLDDNYIRYFGKQFEFRQDTDYTEQHLTGLNSIEYSLDSGTTGGIFEPKFLEKVDAFSSWLKEQPNVIFVSALPSMIKRLNQAVEGGGADAYRIGDTREKNAQNFLLYELSLPVGQDLTGFVDIDRAKTLLSVSIRGGSSQAIQRLAAAGDNWLKTNAPEISGKASGLSLAFAYVSERNLKSMVVGTVVALVLVSLILLLAFQSVKIGLLTLIPNLLPGLLAFGIWGFLVGDVNLAATVVTSMTFGIIVDDTIHITMKYLRGRRVLGESPDAAVRYTLSIVGFPVFLTTVAIASGFAVIAMSGFQLSHYLGSLTVLIVCIALIADLFLLPPLLLVTERIKR